MHDPDGQIATQLERIIRRVKQSMRYHGSYSTRDILDSLVARWVQSGEWERLKQLPSEQRCLGQSVRRFILDRFEQLRRRGTQEPDDALLQIPADDELVAMVEAAELAAWVRARVAELEAAQVDPRVRLPVAEPVEIGRALRLHLEGRTQREIAGELGISLGLVNKRIADGTSYLVLLQGLACALA
jgi:hypothetical protein